jgi:hypothetical protein
MTAALMWLAHSHAGIAPTLAYEEAGCGLYSLVRGAE